MPLAKSSRSAAGGAKQWVGMEEDFLEEIDLRSPASQRQIDECEAFVDRQFSPSYRQFLRLHDGWRGFDDGEGWLFGAKDFMVDPEGRQTIARTMYGLVLGQFLEYKGDWFLDWPRNRDDPPSIYYPEKFFRCLDGAIVEPGFEKLVDYVRERKAHDNEFFLFSHTLIGITRLGYVFLDSDQVKPDGEMEVMVFGREYDAPVRDVDFAGFLGRRAAGAKHSQS